jgi:hypothetical protein
MPIDYGNLAFYISIMTPKTKLYKVLKKELSLRGYWKNKPRGNSSKGFEGQQRTLAQGR